MFNKRDINLAVVLFFIALVFRVLFFVFGSLYFPDNIQKFFTADTIFYYDPLALEIASGSHMGFSLLSLTRIVFLGYLSLFYHYFGYHHWPVSIFHCILGAMSVVFIFLSSRLFLKEKAALVIGLIATFQITLVYWTPFVTSEAPFLFFFSLSIFIFALFLKTQRAKFIIMLFISLLLLTFCRPTGITFLLAVILFFEWRFFKKYRRRVFYFILANLIAISIVAALSLRYRDKIDTVLKQEYPQTFLRHAFYIDELPSGRAYSARIFLPAWLKIPKSNFIPQEIDTKALFDYFKDHPKKYAILFISRIFTSFNPWVPEYSFRHNLFNTLFYGVIYLFSLAGILRLYRVALGLSIIILLAVSSQIFLIGLIVADYDFRFRLPIELILNIPAGYAVYELINIKRRRVRA